MTTHKGFDASHHNGSVDFGLAKIGGCEFAGLKATEGATATDPTFADRRARAHAVGMHKVLLYHFFRPEVDACAQALHFAAVVGSLAPNETVAIDVEAALQGGRDAWSGLSPVESATVVLDFVRHLKAALGIPAASVTLYGSLGWLRGQFGAHLRDLTFMPLWAARYASALGDVSPWAFATIWQNSEHGTVPGVSSPGQVDTDVWVHEESWA